MRKTKIKLYQTKSAFDMFYGNNLESKLITKINFCSKNNSYQLMLLYMAVAHILSMDMLLLSLALLSLVLLSLVLLQLLLLQLS